MTETLTHGAPGVDDLDALYPAGELLPESLPHERVRGDTRPVLEHHFDSRGDVLVGSNLRLYYRAGPPGESVEPDVLVVAGVDMAQLADIKSYRTFQHGGELLFVLEIASESTADADDDRKRATYAAIGVAEYWCVDPTGGEIRSEILQGERLHDGRWTPIAISVDDTGTWRGHSQSLNLDIAWSYRELLFYLPGHDEPLPNLARADAARREAESARQAAESAHRAEQTARLAAEAENARLRELLRRNGGPEDGQADDPPG